MGWLQGTVVLGGGGSLGARAHTITAPMTVQITTVDRLRGIRIFFIPSDE